MTDDTGWNDFGCYTGGGAALGHPTPNIDRIAKEGASNDIMPNLQTPENPVPLLDINNPPKTKGSGG
jgi:hypothetical protein